jgi:hypothetical protein
MIVIFMAQNGAEYPAVFNKDVVMLFLGLILAIMVVSKRA